MDNYKNYRNLGLYDNLQEDFAKNFTPKDPKVYDDILLKQLSCSHILQDKFISRNSNVQTRCKACGLWDSGDTTL